MPLRYTGVEWTPNKSQHRKVALENEFSRRSCRETNSQLFDHEPGALPTSYSGSHGTGYDLTNFDGDKMRANSQACSGGGGFFLACEDLGRRFDESFPSPPLPHPAPPFFFLSDDQFVRANSLFRPGSVHSASDWMRADSRAAEITVDEHPLSSYV